MDKQNQQTICKKYQLEINSDKEFRN